MLKQGTRIFYFIQAALDKVQDKAPDPNTNDQEAKARYSAFIEERALIPLLMSPQLFTGLTPLPPFSIPLLLLQSVAASLTSIPKFISHFHKLVVVVSWTRILVL